MSFKKSFSRIADKKRLIVLLAAWFLMISLLSFSPALAQTPGRMIPASFADVAEKASSAVVNISTVKRVPGGGAQYFRGPSTPFEDPFDFFEKFFGDQGQLREHKERSLGTGFFIDPSGLIITNNHVVDGADDILVKVTDQKEYHAKVIGRDPKTDLALIKIEGRGGWPSLSLGDSSSTRIGDWVVAIGNPFGLTHTVTAGILSAKGRVIGAGPYDDFLQTDASINPGNSGGPLLNLAGEVIGINSAIIAGGQGIGFAIPANLAKDIVAQLKEKGQVVRGWLGVVIQKVTPELAKSFGLNNDQGALVSEVSPGGPADKAGIKRGDVIVTFNQREIKSSNDLPVVVAATQEGSEAKVQVIREGKKETLTVKVGRLEEEKMAAAAGPTRTGNLGLSVRDLDREIAERLGLAGTSGILVAAVADGSPAAEAGMRAGDLIIELNRQPLKRVSEFKKALSKIEKGQPLLFLVKRGRATIFITLNAE